MDTNPSSESSAAAAAKPVDDCNVTVPSTSPVAWGDDVVHRLSRRRNAVRRKRGMQKQLSPLPSSVTHADDVDGTEKVTVQFPGNRLISPSDDIPFDKLAFNSTAETVASDEQSDYSWLMPGADRPEKSVVEETETVDRSLTVAVDVSVSSVTNNSSPMFSTPLPVSSNKDAANVQSREPVSTSRPETAGDEASGNVQNEDTARRALFTDDTDVYNQFRSKDSAQTDKSSKSKRQSTEGTGSLKIKFLLEMRLVQCAYRILHLVPVSNSSTVLCER